MILDRRKRFLADVRLADGTEVVAHLANTGRMTGCWRPGGTVRLSHSDDPKRKLAWSVEQSRVDGRWILVNSARPNRIVEEALLAGAIRGLAGPLAREVAWPEGGRADFRMADGTWVEVKNATLWRDGEVVFPDTVTERGLRHLQTLRARVDAGERAVLFLCVGVEQAEAFRPAADLDPAWSAAFAEGIAAGVEAMAYRVRLTAEDATITSSVPILLPARSSAP